MDQTPNSTQNDSQHDAVQVRVAGYRDPDGDTELTVFVNGVPVNPVIDIIDPGRSGPYPLSEWREQLYDLETADGPDAWKQAMVAFYLRAEQGSYVYNDTQTARDMQPGINAIDRLDPALWIDNRIAVPDPEDETSGMRYRLICSPLTPDQWVYNNTVRAGWALAAVCAYHGWKTGHVYELPAELAERDEKHGVEFMPALGAEDGALAAAVTAYRQHVSASTLGELTTDLLGDLRHLADAKNIVLAASDDAPLYTTMHRLITHLRKAFATTWKEATEMDFDDMRHTAYRRYVEEITGDL